MTPRTAPRRYPTEPIDDPDDWPAELPPSVTSAPVDGGLICATTRDRLADGREVIVKRCPYPADLEAEGLRALAAAGAPVPAVLGVGAFVLVLELLQAPVGSGPPSDDDWSGLGAAVARMHRSTGPAYGWPRDNPAGRFDQGNAWCDDWREFFVQHRILAHLDPVPESGSGSPTRLVSDGGAAAPTRLHEVPAPVAHRLRAACDGPLPDLLPAHPPASLTHGDLWSGNVIGGRWLVDPAVCYADRELDLAFMEGSATLPEAFFEAYRAEYPPDAGYPQRRPALQLHKMLVGLRHFGPRRLAQLTAVLDHYGW